MPKVTASATMFSKESCVSAVTTPFGHLAAVSIASGCTGPLMKEGAHSRSITWPEGAAPVSTVAW
jgi:hypothetical protein